MILRYFRAVPLTGTDGRYLEIVFMKGSQNNVYYWRIVEAELRDRAIAVVGWLPA